MHPVGLEPTTFFRSRIMSAVQSTPLPWMLRFLNMAKNLLKKFNPFDFFILLCAFLYGNIFTIQCSTLNWGFVLIFGVVVLIEILEKSVYFFFTNQKQEICPKNTKFFFNFVEHGIPLLIKEKTFSSFFLLNTAKRGFLLGFFLEAFKVGS